MPTRIRPTMQICDRLNCQTSLDLPTPEDFENDEEGGKLNIAVNGHRLKSIPFEVIII